MLTLYTAATPNGQKISIALEELELPYKVYWMDLPNAEQKKPWFTAINPNGRVPAIVDHDENDFVLFESGAILIYLAEKHGRLMPRDLKGRSIVTQWLMFQMSAIGPMMGQANVFYRYLPEKSQVAIDRFQAETRRLLNVLNDRLAANEYLARDYSIADIANWTWVRLHFWAGVDIEDLEHLKRWIAQVGARPAVKRGVAVPEDILEKLRSASGAEEIKRSAAGLVETKR